MKSLEEIIQYHLFECVEAATNPEDSRQFGGMGYIHHGQMKVIFSVSPVGDGSGEWWDHVSVSRKNRIPSWQDMLDVRYVFFKPEEWAMQLHPPLTENINCHPFCLHIWRPHHAIIPQPPRWMIAP